MESATQALYMAFAVIVFTLALSISMTMFSRARATSDAILYNTDETNFLNYQDFNQYAGDGNNRNRIVGLETVIPTLYRYYKENYTVVFRKAKNRDDFLEKVANKNPIELHTDYEYIELYENNTEYENWQEVPPGSGVKAYDSTDYDGGTDPKTKFIYSFDLDEETKRNEPWTGSVDEIKKNLDAFINGEIYYNPSYDDHSDPNAEYQDYGGGIIEILTGGTINTNPQFLEQIGEYVVDDDSDPNTDQYDYAATDDDTIYDTSGGTVINVDGEDINLLTQTKKRVIIYTLLP